MKITNTTKDSSMIISLEGRLDTTTAPDLEKEIENNVKENIKELTIDMKELEYISSAGLRVLLATKKLMNNRGEFIIKNPNDEVYEVFEMTGFTEMLTIER